MKAEQLIALKKRVQTLEIEMAKATQRVETAVEDAKKAKARLKKLGFDPEHVDEELTELYERILEKVEIAEDILGIKR